jgi:excisionase family DNA binding protein
VSVDRNYSVKESCRILGICNSKLYLEIKSGALVAHKLGRRTVIHESDLEAYQQALPTLGRAA